MSAFNAYPPIRHHSSQPISASHAQQLLAEFLERTATDPSLHPNALLTEDGPVNRSATMGLVLHNLRRVEAGLRGEHLAADLTFKNLGGEGLPDMMSSTATKGGGDEERSKGNANKDQDADWQDKDEYEREQAIEQGEIGSRSNALEDTNIDRGLSNEGGEIPAVQHVKGSSRAEKDERKRKKKEKREQMKKKREKELAERHKG
ncbi:MAG: hypothetical protein Q9225_000104 [Loekoesia sp. 1 TL-2023]